MYVSPNCPLPRNSLDPVTACEAAHAKRITQGLETSVQNAFRASRAIAGPESFASFSPQLAREVKRYQDGMKAANGTHAVQPVNRRAEVMAAPIVLPLNVSEEEYGSCCPRGVPPYLGMQTSSCTGPWADASLHRNWQRVGNGNGPVDWKTWLLVAAGGFGLYAMNKER
jgi:hypothetical protein